MVFLRALAICLLLAPFAAVSATPAGAAPGVCQLAPQVCAQAGTAKRGVTFNRFTPRIVRQMACSSRCRSRCRAIQSSCRGSWARCAARVRACLAGCGC